MESPLKSLLLAVTTFAVAIGLSQTAMAQKTIEDDSTGRTLYLNGYLGGYAGLGINLHTAAFGALPGVPSCCPEYKDATSLGFAIGVSYELPLAEKLSLQTRLGYATLYGELSTDETIGNEPVLDDGQVPTETRKDVIVQHTLEASAPMIVLEPSVGYEIFRHFVASAGARVGYMFSSSFAQQERLFTPEGYTFLNGSAVRNEQSGPIPDANAIQAHVVVGLGYTLPLSQRMSLVPEVRYYIPLTNVSSVDWEVQTFQIGVNVRYGLYSPKERKVIRDTVVRRDTTTVQKSGIIAEVISMVDSRTKDNTVEDGDFSYITTIITESYLVETPRPFNPNLATAFIATDGGIRKNVDSIRIEELDVIESYPILPQIYYDTVSADLNRSDQVVLTRNRVSSFVPEELKRDQLDIYKNMLNIIGVRMQKNPVAKLTLTGTTDDLNGEKNNRELAVRRAEGVKLYLMNVFGIEDERIIAQGRLLPEQPANPTTEDGQAENRRVEIAADDVSILEPVEFRDKDLIIAPTDFTLSPTVTDFQDINEWDAEIFQGGRKLASSKGSGRPSPLKWDAASAGTAVKDDKPVIGTVKVRSEIGQERIASDTLDIDYVTLQLMSSSSKEGKRIERYSLIVFDFNSSKLNKSNQRVMERIKSRIEDDSKVRIIGYADRQGKPEYNQRLARNRCIEAQRVLGLPDSRVSIEPIGSDKLLYNNDTPEGRSYSRTVQIEVETPLKN